MCWAALLEASLVVCATASGAANLPQYGRRLSGATVFRYCSTVLCAQHAVLYVVAAFWKLTTPLLVLSPRAGVVAGLLFHTSINLLPLNYAAGFSLMCATLSWGIGGPVLGLQQMSGLTMYANLKHWGGSNHLLLPTNLLAETDWLPEAASRAKLPLLSALLAIFGRAQGQVVRVDATNSSVLRELSPADSTPLLPAHAVALMRASGASGRYYGQYCARMFVGRDNDLPSSGTIGNAVAGAGPKSAGAEEGEELPYALTAYELRRLLAAARAHGEPFTLTFTPSLPTAGSPADWRDFVGDSASLVEDPSAGRAECTIAGADCASHKAAAVVALMSAAPPRWLSKVLMAYPVPLLPPSEADPGTEVHCSA
ncbi:hypothetical protein EMIHUDRAFT_456341 [Emiliania huxleyi CCMP1516]|uniref:HTTM domain-containing protein n=2 Tax=Emiliania huxleyi TaxID=2903 RepID=A0A0D3K6K9_EMIH1|nr:hypothetical protein EMIHUDRAFT_456341 [Emiliania huxleyi CCMP1516]EOD31394.1 hypothetical protein EMIHUDRAFT_456341 [Emiliania huxleyi CCMP1516]|eukprot:XP_005783823.1 hypothetical protein EMIHUDRAFT_456341 [Emiliania huxleyi CCMP1516]